MDKKEREKILLRRFEDIDYYSVSKELARDCDKLEQELKETKEKLSVVSHDLHMALPED